MRIKTFIFFISILFTWSYTIAFPLDSANAAYKKGDYLKAMKEYETFLAKGYDSPELYYNLGNTYFRLKNIPKSILNYERAHLLEPENEDISFNLNLANSFVSDKVTPVPEFILYSWMKFIMNKLTSNGWALWGIFQFGISLILFLLFLFSHSTLHRKILTGAGITILVLGSIATIFAIETRSEILQTRTAIIMSPVTTAKSSPDDQSTDLFIIHEGTKVIINEELDDWSEIKLLDGNVGWVKTTDFDKI
jgi:tetratricopeptide (TPR) repeat protein